MYTQHKKSQNLALYKLEKISDLIFVNKTLTANLNAKVCIDNDVWSGCNNKVLRKHCESVIKY